MFFMKTAAGSERVRLFLLQILQPLVLLQEVLLLLEYEYCDHLCCCCCTYVITTAPATTTTTPISPSAAAASVKLTERSRSVEQIRD